MCKCPKMEKSVCLKKKKKRNQLINKIKWTYGRTCRSRSGSPSWSSGTRGPSPCPPRSRCPRGWWRTPPRRWAWTWPCTAEREPPFTRQNPPTISTFTRPGVPWEAPTYHWVEGRHQAGEDLLPGRRHRHLEFSSGVGPDAVACQLPHLGHASVGAGTHSQPQQQQPQQQQSTAQKPMPGLFLCVHICN